VLRHRMLQRRPGCKTGECAYPGELPKRSTSTILYPAVRTAYHRRFCQKMLVREHHRAYPADTTDPSLETTRPQEERGSRDSDEASSFTDSFKIGSLSTEKSFSGSFSLLNNRASTAGTAAESTNEAGKHDVELKEDAGGLVAPPPSGDSTAAYEQGLSRRSLQRKNSEERIAQRLESLVYALPPYAPYPGACCDAAITSH
jgi:hypothetical protein